MTQKSSLNYRWLVIVPIFLFGAAIASSSFKSLVLAAECQKGVIVDSACDSVEHIKMGEMSQEMKFFGFGWTLICSSIGSPVCVWLGRKFEKQT